MEDMIGRKNMRDGRTAAHRQITRVSKVRVVIHSQRLSMRAASREIFFSARRERVYVGLTSAPPYEKDELQADCCIL